MTEAFIHASSDPGEALDPVGILRHKSKDPSLGRDAVLILRSAIAYLSDFADLERRLALWKEGRL
jgi:hypothetical protein